jgi:hypothetical protein
MIHVRLLPKQISIMWEYIKYVSAKSGGLDESQYNSYFNYLLYRLLSGKYQCFMKLDDNRSLQVIWITKIDIDNITGEKSLSVVSIYSFKSVLSQSNKSSRDISWKEGLEFGKQFAIKEGCKTITATSSVERVWELCYMIGLKEKSRTFVIDL